MALAAAAQSRQVIGASAAQILVFRIEKVAEISCSALVKLADYGQMTNPIHPDLDLETVCASMPDGLALFDDHDTLIWFNQSFHSTFGDDPCGALRDAVAACSQTNLCIDGRWFSIQMRRHPTLVDAKICQATDITEQTFADDRHRMSAGVLEALVEASPMAILMLDLEKRVTLWNPAAERIFGWTFEELRGQPYPLVPDDGWAEFEVFFETVVQGEGFSGVEARRTCKDGTTVDLEIATAPLCNADGVVVGAMAILDSRTEQKQLEARYRQAQKMEAVGRLAGGIAHDFNNALTVILNACEIARMRHPDSPVLDDVATIERAGRRAAELTRQLLAFSRRQVLQPLVIDLNEVVASSVDMLRRVIGEDITVQTLLDSRLGCVLADPGQLEQLVMNLALNARDAMPNGGVMTLSTRELGPGHQFGDGVWVELKVMDTGMGIAPDVLPHIFEPFFTTKDAGTGSGLGLASVYGVVHQSGGEVLVEANQGSGAVFRVLFPVTEGEPARRAPVLPVPRAAGQCSILVVEDEQAVRAVISTVLQSHGYEVLLAASGQEALDLATTLPQPIDLLLSDVVMPGMNGRQLAEQFSRAWPDTRVLLMSGYTDDVLVRTGANAGLPFLNKPFSPSQLLRAISQVLSQGQIGSATSPGQ